MFMAFNVAVPFDDLAILSAWTTLILVVPISINGLGITEGVFVAALAKYGYGTEQVLSASLTGRTSWALTLLVCSALYWGLQRREKVA